MDVIKPPKPLKLTGNIDYAWIQFKQAFQLYLTATGANDDSGERKVALLLTIAGTQAIEIFNSGSLMHTVVRRRMKYTRDMFFVAAYSSKMNRLTRM